MFNSFDFLIVLMALSGYKNNITGLRQHTCCFDSFAPVGNADGLLHVVFIQSGKHIIDDILRLFKAGVVRSDDNTIACFGRLFCHDGAFTFVSVAACTYYSNYFPFSFEYAVNGIQNIDESVRCVCIVHNGSDTFG